MKIIRCRGELFRTLEYSCKSIVLARQAIPLRGNWDQEECAEKDSNFHQLLIMRAEEDEELIKWLEGKQQKYTSPVIQNEIIEVRRNNCLAIHLLR